MHVQRREFSSHLWGIGASSSINPLKQAPWGSSFAISPFTPHSSLPPGLSQLHPSRSTTPLTFLILSGTIGIPVLVYDYGSNLLLVCLLNLVLFSCPPPSHLWQILRYPPRAGFHIWGDSSRHQTRSSIRVCVHTHELPLVWIICTWNLQEAMGYFSRVCWTRVYHSVHPIRNQLCYIGLDTV